MERDELNTYWKTVVDTIQEGLMIVSPAGRIVSVNRAFLELTGFTKEEIIGEPCSRLNCTSCDIERKQTPHHLCRLFRDGAFSGHQCILKRKDGLEMHILKNALVLRDENGQVFGAVETITDISELIEHKLKIEAFKKELNRQDTFHGIVGQSASMQKVFNLISNAAESDAPIIILGESGTGKELVARAVHESSNRRNKPYIKVNCAALNESLLESELFGHVRGAFTGAGQNRIGRFEAAGEGTVFLDEIGEIPLATQVKLLRVIEEKVIERVGDNRPVPIRARIITATNRDLVKAVRDGSFREDFYYRINVIPIYIPPVRERGNDITLLIESFFNRMQLKTGKNISGVSKQAMELLIHYSWPGNVRELKSVFEYAFVTSQGPVIQPSDLPRGLQQVEGKIVEKSVDLTFSERKKNGDEQQRQELLNALNKCGGNRIKTAEMLGISRVTVWNRMKKFNIRVEDNRRFS